MPILETEKRQRINAQRARRQEIHDAMPKYLQLHCKLCNWAVNALTFDDAIEGVKVHQETHPEFEEWTTLTIPMNEIRDSLHDHECQQKKCSCICGCDDGPFCTLVFGPLCSVCMVRESRGDSEHGETVDGIG